MDKVIRRIPTIGIGLVVSYALLLLLQIWTGALESGWFVKLTFSYGVCGVVLGLVYLLYREVRDEQKLKDDHYLD
jgi:flagellar biosynthesis protein FliR